MRARATPRIISIDVSSPYREEFRRWSTRQGVEFSGFTSEEAAYSVAHTTETILCLIEARDRDLMTRVTSMRKLVGPTPFVVLSSDVTIATTVDLMRAGVRDVISLPDHATDVVAKATGNVSNRKVPSSTHKLIGRSEPMRRVRQEIEAVAPLMSTVLITGETGTGKGLAARMIHELSRRADRPFVHVDCGALAPTVIESELFGHERGAFTGAASERAGRFETARDGTIFLDEIGELDVGLQRKFLRVLQDGVFERLGGSKSRGMSARILAATNRDLEGDVRAGRFRADLMFRLNVFRVDMPPLREHPDDIPALVRSGLDDLARRLQVTAPSLPDDVYAKLAAREWPGNVRELMNVLERILIRHHAGLLDDSSIDEIVSPQPIRPRLPGAGPTELPAPGSDEERAILEAALAATGGNVARVARRLGVARSTLRYRLQLHDLSDLIPND